MDTREAVAFRIRQLCAARKITPYRLRAGENQCRHTLILYSIRFCMSIAFL